MTVLLLGTIAGAVQAKAHANAKQALQHATATEANHKAPSSTVAPHDNALEALTEEVEDLRETVEEETIVDDVLTSPWFDILGIIGSGITASSFYVEWLSKRSKPLT
ncbi:MAG TPA: hypothetical protein VH597_17265 [Verrucomicrobiae bacterium]|nr:hypothetical protein [Verrucomicrobiae bacterium]